MDKGTLDTRQLKLGVIGFLVVLLTSMLSLKPYLPSALYHNFPTLYDYQFFSNRVVHAKPPGTAWPISPHSLTAPSAETQKRLIDLQTTALVVIEDGKIVYENYSDGGGKSVISNSFSMSKSILSILYGFAQEEGRIKNLDEPVARYLPEWQDREEGKITIRNLLTMTSGLNWKESFKNPFAISAEAYYGRDLHVTALRQQKLEEPGVNFSYQSGSTQLLGLILTRATNMTLSDYLSKKLWGPLGAEQDALWSLDHEEGMEKAFCCLNATALDYARMGEFLRLKGQWDGKSLVSEKYLQQMITPNSRNFGMGWWVFPSVQGPIPFAWGILGQYIIVVPQKNRVLVRLGKKMGKIKNGFPEEVQALTDWVLNAP